MLQVLDLLDRREEDPSPVLLLCEVLDRRPERALEHVVGEHDADPVAGSEPLRQPERLGDPAGLLLVGVEEPVDPVLVPVAEQPKELARVRPPGDEHQLVDPGVDECLDRKIDHRPVVDRQQVLVRDPRERMESGAGAACQDDALHRGQMLVA